HGLSGFMVEDCWIHSDGHPHRHVVGGIFYLVRRLSPGETNCKSGSGSGFGDLYCPVSCLLCAEFARPSGPGRRWIYFLGSTRICGETMVRTGCMVLISWIHERNCDPGPVWIIRLGSVPNDTQSTD